jgi:hypothetical protein
MEEFDEKSKSFGPCSYGRKAMRTTNGPKTSRGAFRSIRRRDSSTFGLKDGLSVLELGWGEPGVG